MTAPGVRPGCGLSLRSFGAKGGNLNPRAHALVTDGGISPDGSRWIPCRPGFFLPVRVLARLFRRLFLETLQKAFDSDKLKFVNALELLNQRDAFLAHLARARKSDWVVYAKAPFAGPEQVLDYVGRYTHRIAISNNRLVGIDDGKVSFRWKDYRDGNRQKTMTVSAEEFIRRFLLHVLPGGFQRIRYFGFLGNRHRKRKLERCRTLLAMPQPETPSETLKDYRDRYEERTGFSLRQCPVCHEGRMRFLEPLPRARSCPQITDTS